MLSAIGVEQVTSPDVVRAMLGQPEAPAIKKQIDFLDEHCRRFIAMAPLMFISSANAAGLCDVSPKGDAPGFARVLSERLLVIPERPGNRRADTLRNILENPHIGLIFLIPGLRETLRINGTAGLFRDRELLELLAFQGKTPILAIGVEVSEVFLHCGRALVRSHLWEPASWPQPEALPSAGRIFADHMNLPEVTCEAVEHHLEESYTTGLY